MGGKDGFVRDAFLASVDVVIVSYNTRDITLRCVNALCSEPLVASICVVDNASKDGSREALIQRSYVQASAPEGARLRVECLVENRGFGAANNLGVAEAGAEFVALINSDAFVLSGALESMCGYLRANPEVGLVGPRLLNADGSFQESRFHFPSPARAWVENLGLSRLFRPFWSLLNRGGAGAVDWLSGACLLVRREVWEQTGGFDEDFFLYSEETDWQVRIRQMGWGIHWVPEALAIHLGGSSGVNQREVVRERFYESVDLYFLKHFGRFGALSLRAATVVGAALRWLGAAVCASAVGKKNSAWVFLRQSTRALPPH
jgi:GT2 family glycosyltransferase